MRNLKKVLALVLALVMSMSLITIANASDFSDDADIKYDEAVDVMVAAGIIDGVGNNSFDPNGTLTREQAAKLITYMLLGENSDKLGVEGTSFNDVAATRWSAPAIEYCASLGIIDGAGDGNFYPAGKLTGYAFAKMLLTAIGYDSQLEGFTGAGWTIPVASIGMEVGLDNGLEKMFGSAEISRQEAAQMALNAIKTPLVEYNKQATISVNGAEVSLGDKEASYVTTTIARTQTISKQKLSNSNDYTIEFGEKYLPKLELQTDVDDFGRPSYTWAYDKKVIGTYLDDTDLVAEFTTKVTGKDLYDAITKNVMEHLADDVLTVYIDGETKVANNPAVFTDSVIKRTNNDGVGATEKGVLTQVFVTRIEGDDETKYDVKIVIINTYLAIATEDYDTKNEEVDIEIYAIDNFGTSKNPDFIKATDQEKDTATVKNDDINVENVKEDDKYLVTVAAGKVQTMVAPEIVADASIDSFKLHEDVTVEGTTYEYAHTAKYDVEVLDDYSKTNLKDTTYNVVLDPYGYLIGIEQNTEADQYVFLTGMEGNTSDLSTKNADANVIFLDGRMETVTVNVSKSDDALMSASGPLMNTWCTYSVNSAGVYTLKQVSTVAGDKIKVMQSAMNADDADDDEIKIDKKNVTLTGIGTAKVYGNNDTIYLNVSTSPIKAATNAEADPDQPAKHWHAVIDDVDSVTVGVRNTSLVAANQVAGDGTKKEVDNVGDTDGPVVSDEEVYPLFKDNGYIIAAVVIGEDDGVSKTYAYVHTEDVKRESYNKADDEWTWTREAIVDGKITELKEVGGGTDLSDLEDMIQGRWYEVKFDADGNVKSATEVPFAGTAGVAEAGQFIKEVLDVEKSVNDEDTVILQQAGMAGGANSKLTYKSGTLYTTEDKDEALGFSVSPDVKVVLCLSDGEGTDWDDCDDTYTGYAGLERAIRNLDSNFVGELNAVFDNGDAVVIILVDTTDAEDDGDDDGDDGEENTDTHAKAVVDDASLVIESLITVDGNYKTPIADALKAKGLRVTGWTEAAAGTPAAGDTVTAVDDKGTVFTYEFGTAAATPDEEYWTLKVDGTVKEEILDGEDSKLMQSAITGKGTGYLTGTTYAAYAPAATTTPAASSVSAPVAINTGYVTVAAVTSSADVTGKGNGADNGTVAITGYTANVKAGSKLTVTVTMAATAGATAGSTVTVTVTGATAPAAQTITSAEAVAGKVLTFEITVGETNITAVGATIIETP